MAESIADGHLSIGEVLGVLLQEFPDVTISKIRFLESQGLIAPERTPSGYRKFYSDDVDLLRVILTEQRENYLPLRVIKDRLDSGEIDPTGEHLRPVIDGVVKSAPAEAETDAPSDPAPAADTVGQTGDGQPRVSPSRTDKVADTAVDTGASDVDSKATTVASLPAPSTPQSDAQAEPQPLLSAAPTLRSLTTVPTAKSGPDPAGSPAAEPKQDRSNGLTPPTDLRPASKSADSKAADSDRDATDSAPTEEVPATSVVAHPAARSAARREERRSASPRLLPGVMLDAGELCGMVGITRAELEELEAFGIIVGRDVIGGRVYTEDAVEIAKPAGALLRAGVDSRHLRAWRTAAEREASLYEQLIAPRLRQRNPEARAEAMAQLAELESTGDALHDALVRSALRPHFEA